MIAPMRAVAVLALVGVGACASIPADGGGAEVGAEARERLALPEQSASSPDADVDAALRGRMTAARAMALAWEHNGELRSALAALGEARGAVLSAGAWRNPQVDAELQFGEAGAEMRLGFSVLQDVTALFYASAQGASARAELRAAQADALAAVLRVAFEAQRAFVAWQATVSRAALARTALAAADAGAEAARALHASGNFSDLSLCAELDAAESARLASHRATVEVVQASEGLAAALGVSGEQRWVPDASLPEPPSAPLDAMALERTAVERSAMLAALRDRSAAARAVAGAAGVQGWLPAVELGVAAEREERHWHVGPVLELELPLFDQGQGTRASARARAERLDAQQDVAAVRVRSELRRAVVRARAAQERLAHLRDVVVPLRARLLQETQLAVNAMSASVFQLLAAKTAELEARRMEVDAREAYWHARSQVEELVAGGGASAVTPTGTDEGGVEMRRATGGHG